MRAVVAAVLVLAALVGGLALVVLGGSAAADFPAVRLEAGRARPQGDVFRSPTTEPPTLNPFTTRDQVAARYVLPFTHDALVDLDPVSAAWRPAAAAGWEVGEDGRVVTFQLREDLRFADGTAVGREDLEFTLATCRDPRLAPQSQMAFLLAELQAAEAPDARTIRLRLPEPRAQPEIALGAGLRIAQRRFFVEAAAALDPAAADPGSDAFFTRLPEIVRCGPGTGAYAEQEVVLGSTGWIAGSHLNLVPNPSSWRRRAQPESWNLAGLQLRFVVDEAARLAAARGGAVDWFLSMAGTDLAALQAGDAGLARDFVLHSYTPLHLGHYFVLWNCRRPPFDDPRVRRALGLLFDRDAICREVFGGQATVAKGYFRPGSPEYPDRLEAPRFAPAEAARALGELGFSAAANPLRVELLCAVEVPVLRQIAERAAAAFRSAGVELVVQPLELGSLFDRQERGAFDAVLWIQQHEPVIDPLDFFAAGANDMGQDDPAMDELLRRARATADPGERAGLYHRFQERLAEQQPISLLVHPRIAVLVSRRFRDAVPGPLGLWPERFWVPEAEQRVR
jgi:peptide/nickel transport system substrate-binding protein